jgi:hypothetical protein
VPRFDARVESGAPEPRDEPCGDAELSEPLELDESADATAGAVAATAAPTPKAATADPNRTTYFEVVTTHPGWCRNRV